MIVLVPLALLGVAVWADVRTREIPDTVSVLMLVCALGCRAFGWDSVSWGATALGAAVAFALPAVLFYAGGLGGGDVKLLGAIGALLGWPAALQLLLGTAVAGGALALVTLYGSSRSRASAGPEAGDVSDEDFADREAGAPELPYAIAIAAGFCFACLQGPWPQMQGAGL
ncbi:MAG: hypothetical protein DHS20C15_04080 [Planctomycetota bacterium]|nr:MAG: hypothetical protein DHS20C15_04080 [Planctomycetota bacterium]